MPIVIANAKSSTEGPAPVFVAEILSYLAMVMHVRVHFFHEHTRYLSNAQSTFKKATISLTGTAVYKGRSAKVSHLVTHLISLIKKPQACLTCI